jgi:hypothetical protein
VNTLYYGSEYYYSLARHGSEYDKNRNRLEVECGANDFRSDADLQGFPECPSPDDLDGPVEGPQERRWPLANLERIPGPLGPHAGSQTAKVKTGAGRLETPTPPAMIPAPKKEGPDGESGPEIRRNNLDTRYNDKVSEKQEISIVRTASAELSQNLYRHPDRFVESNHEDYVWLRRVTKAKAA